MTAEQKQSFQILAPISLGELIDKITILEIKKDHMTGGKLINVCKELKSLNFILQEKNLDIKINLINELKKINNRLWEIEDKIRIKENLKEFDQEFINLARSVYKENDQRASIKKEINSTFNSEFVEEKFYSNN